MISVWFTFFKNAMQAIKNRSASYSNFVEFVGCILKAELKHIVRINNHMLETSVFRIFGTVFVLLRLKYSARTQTRSCYLCVFISTTCISEPPSWKPFKINLNISLHHYDGLFEVRSLVYKVLSNFHVDFSSFLFVYRAYTSWICFILTSGFSGYFDGATLFIRWL